MFLSNSVHTHFRLLKKAVKMPLEQLKADAPNSLMVDSVREAVLVIEDKEILVRRVYVNTLGSSRFAEVGWVMEEDIHSCLCCQKAFSTVTRKHHCRSCGSLICKDCSTHTMIIGFSALKTQIVCKSCNPNASMGICLHNLTYWGEVVFEPSRHPQGVINSNAEPGAAHFALYTPLSVEVVPQPGYVIKTRHTNNLEKKVFINVFHHSMVVDTQEMLVYIPGVSPPKKVVKQRKESPRSVTFANTNTNNHNTTHTSTPHKPPHTPHTSTPHTSTPHTTHNSTPHTPHTPHTTPRTPMSPQTPGTPLMRYSSFSSDKRVAHVYSDYQKYVRSKSGSPDTDEGASNNSSSNSLVTMSYAPNTATALYTTSVNASRSNSNTNIYPTTPITHNTNHDSTTHTTRTSIGTDNSAFTSVKKYENVTPLLYLGETGVTTDRDGSEIMVYNVLVSSSYFTPEAVRGVVTVFNPSTVNKIIQVINHHYNEDLRERTFSLPKIRLGYKGYTAVSAMNSPIRVKGDSASSPVDAGAGSGGTVGSGATATTNTTNADTTTISNTSNVSTTNNTPTTDILPCIEFYRTECSVECVPESECSAEDSGRYSVCSEAGSSNSSTTALDALNNAMYNTSLSGSGGSGGQDSNRTSPELMRTFSYTSTDSNSTTNNSTDYTLANTYANSVTTNTTTSTTANATNGNTALRSLGVRKISNSKDWYTTSRKLSSALRSSNTSTSSSVYKHSSVVLTPQMLDIRPMSCISVHVSDDLKEQSVANPRVLLGYQIIFPYTATSEHGHGPIADQSQVYIITDVRRDAHFHTEYRLTQYANHEKHRWERLKRSARKTGTDFRITCRSFTM